MAGLSQKGFHTLGVLHACIQSSVTRPLLFDASTGNKEIVDALLKAKAVADAANEAGHTGLMMAATNGYQKDPKGAVEVTARLWLRRQKPCIRWRTEPIR